LNSLGITRVGIRLITAGLADLVGYELAADTGGAEMEQEFLLMMEFLAAYATAEGRKFAPEETLLHGYWTLKFRVSPQDRALLDLWEYDAATTGWIPGVRYAVECWAMQHRKCRESSAGFHAPRLDQLAVISDGVLDGDPWTAVRYPSPPHMSGWWMTTDRYDGDVASLKTDHLYHVTDCRPEIMPYIALPEGYRVDPAASPSAWFDQTVSQAN